MSRLEGGLNGLKADPPARADDQDCRHGVLLPVARPCSHTAAQPASNGSNPRARIAAVIPASTSPVPAVASQGGAGGAKPRRPSGEATSVSGPL